MKLLEITIQVFEKVIDNGTTFPHVLADDEIERICDSIESIDFQDIIRNRLNTHDNESIEIRIKD